MSSPEIENLIKMLSRLPGLGPRSARRAALHLIKRRESLLTPLTTVMLRAADSVQTCHVCGNIDSVNPCYICRAENRNGELICVVQDVADVWALERSSEFNGMYHVLGGTLSAIDGRGPEDLTIGSLIKRVSQNKITEIILGTSATVEGQTTAHYIADRLEELKSEINMSLIVSRLAHGVPVGGELDYLDDGTLSTALSSRRPI